MEKILKEWNRWQELAVDDLDLQFDLSEMQFDEEKRRDCFYRNLEFGTGGLRGVIGAGTNRMNIYVIQKATQGLANYLLKKYKNPSAAIAYDSRIKSNLFAREAAKVLAGNGIKVYIYEELMPTPALSFAVRYLKCQAGICVTASHNPANYNGYKVYGEDGCQITLTAAEKILDEIEQIDPFKDVVKLDWENGLEINRICFIPEIVKEAYIEAVYKETRGRISTDLYVVYTPLHGAGRACVLEILKRMGVKQVTVVNEQEEPDGNFPTCPYPNPEREEAMELGFALCNKVNADLLLATDPDCDRVGAAVKCGNTYRMISGNEMGVLLLDYIARIRKEKGSMPERPLAIKTIVTTDLAVKVAAHYGIEVLNVLTGFKFIGEQIGQLEKTAESERYILGFEESYGYLSGTYVRDKDAVNASALICEMAAYYKTKGLSLAERMEAIYKQYGYYQNILLDFNFEGAKGITTMRSLMVRLRNGSVPLLEGLNVSEMKDYQLGIKGLPKADVLEYHLDRGDKVIIRPSGTEPKIKIYLFVCRENSEQLRLASQKLEDLINQVFKQYREKPAE